MRSIAIASILVLSTGVAAPALGGTEQTQMRHIANMARLAIDPMGCNPATWDTEGAWTLTGPTCTTCGGTANHKFLARVWNYGWALRARPVGHPDRIKYRDEMLDWINTQQQYVGAPGNLAGPWGHFAVNANQNEELTSTHYQLWAGGMAAAYLFALADGGTLGTTSLTTTTETAVRDAARRWWADEKALYDLVSTSGQMDLPGARFGDPSQYGTNRQRDDVYRLLRGLAASKPFDCTSHKANLSIFALRALLANGVAPLGQPLAGQVPSPKVYDTLCVYRLGAEWTVYFPIMRSVGVDNSLQWVQCRFEGGATCTKGYEGLHPLRSYPGGASLRSIPGVVAGAATCPIPERLGQ